MEYVENYEETNWLAVATDGWTVDLLQELALPRSSLALQRWLNAQGRKRGHFEDDGAVVAWWKTGVTWSHTDQSIHWGVSRRS
jgi:hypothetical protein